MSLIYLPALITKYFMFCSRCPFMALINGIGKPRIHYILGILDGLALRAGCAFLPGHVLPDVQGYWLGNAFGGFGPMFVDSVYYFTGKWEADAKKKVSMGGKTYDI